ncbi:unnamed protein product, partial [marine sediment metagenome]
MEMTGLQVFRPGYGFLPLAEGEKVTLANGDTLRVTVATKYSGPAQTLTLYGAVGTRVPGPYVVGFDEALVGESTDEGHLKCPATTTTPTTPNATGFVDIPIVVNYDAALAPFVGYQDMLPPGKDYDLYVKIKEHPSISDELDDIIDLSTEGAGGTPPAPSLFEMIGPLLMLGVMVLL